MAERLDALFVELQDKGCKICNLFPVVGQFKGTTLECGLGKGEWTAGVGTSFVVTYTEPNDPPNPMPVTGLRTEL